MTGHIFPTRPSASTYVRGCRCDECKKADRERQAARRARTGESSSPVPTAGRTQYCPLCDRFFHPQGFSTHETACARRTS